MKGLLIKDFKLMKMQRTFFLVIIIMAVGMAASMYNIGFVIGYLSFVMPLFVLSTISYDEFDNGRAFLFTLPISRKIYVIEKYCFGILLGAASLVIAVVLALCMEAVMKAGELSDTLIAAPFDFAAMLVIISVFIPLQIKFGSEKGRFALIAVTGITVLLGYGAVKLFNHLNVDIMAFVNNVLSFNIWALLAGAVSIAVCITLLSVKISISILEKKEF